MSKTAREVIVNFPADGGYSRDTGATSVWLGERNADELIAALDAAGFVIVAKNEWEARKAAANESHPQQ